MADEIRTPEWPVIIFGDGAEGRVVRAANTIGRDGTELTEFLVMPSEHMMTHYGLTNENLDEHGLLRRAFPKVYIYPMSNDPIIPKILIMQTFHWGDTDLIKNFPNTQLMQAYQRQVHNLKLENARLNEELRIKTSNQIEYYEKYVLPSLAQMKKVTGPSISQQDLIVEEEQQNG